MPAISSIENFNAVEDTLPRICSCLESTRRESSLGSHVWIDFLIRLQRHYPLQLKQIGVQGFSDCPCLF